MTCRVQAGFTYHAFDFAQGAPTGYAVCGRCDNFIPAERALDESCPASFGKTEAVEPETILAPRPVPAGGLRCVLCGEAVMVEPRHRDYVRFFGPTCDACFNLEVAHA